MKITLVKFCTAFLVILCCVSLVWAQEGGDIETLLSQMQDTLKMVSKERKCAVIVEGQPSPVVLMKRKTEIQAALKSSVFDLEKIAYAYDYSISRFSNLIILKKRYSYPQEMPCITSQECGYATQDILTSIKKTEDSSDYPQDTGSNVNRILSGFSEERREQLLKGQAVPIADFPSQVRKLTWGIMTEQYIVPITQNLGEPAVAILPDFVVRQDEEEQIVYQFTLKGLSEPSKRPIERARVITYDGGNHSSKEMSDFDEITTYQPKTKMTISLGKAMELATQQAQAEYKANTEVIKRPAKYSIAAYLEKKPIALFGASNITSFELSQGIAKVYGLRVRIDKQGDVMLTRRSALPLQNVSDAIRVLQDGLPDPLKRALHQAEIQQLLRRQHKAEADKRPYSELYAIAQERENYEAVYSQLVNEASWQLVTVLEGRFGNPTSVKTNKAKLKFTLDEFNDQDDSRLAVYLARQLINLLSSQREPAWYVSRFDEMSMAFTPQNSPDDTTRGTLTFGLPDPTTGKIVKPLIFISRIKD